MSVQFPGSANGQSVSSGARTRYTRRRRLPQRHASESIEGRLHLSAINVSAVDSLAVHHSVINLFVINLFVINLFVINLSVISSGRVPTR
jgi:hypothetical protein